MTKREFVYSGEVPEKISEQNYAAFILHYQKSVLASLLKRNLLSQVQFNRCVEELEKQFTK